MNTSLLITVLATSGALLALTLAVCCGSLVEVFAQLASIRETVRLDDQPMPIALKSVGMRASSLGLPAELEAAPQVIVVVLSGKCAACRTIAHAFRGGAPENVWFLLEIKESAKHVLTEPLAACATRLVDDAEARIAEAFGVDITPSVIVLSFGMVTRAYAVSSARQVFSLIPSVLPGELLRVIREPVASMEAATN